MFLSIRVNCYNRYNLSDFYIKSFTEYQHRSGPPDADPAFWVDLSNVCASVCVCVHEM